MAHPDNTNAGFQPIDRFKELRVYRLAFEIANSVLKRSRDWPSFENYMLRQQIIRSSRSVCANIGEAWFRKSYPKHFVAKLNDAGSEAMETLVWLDFARDNGYLTEHEYQHLAGKLQHLIGGLVVMTRQPEKWCSKPKTRRKP